MKRRALAALFLALALQGLGLAQIWDKFIAPGLTYRMEVDLAAPRIVHGLKFSPQSSSVRARTEVATRKVFTEDIARSRRSVSAMAKENSALAAVNGDFFPWTGDPIGLMVRNGELVSGPYPNRAVFGWGKSGASGGFGTLGIGARNGSLGTFAIDGLNEECGLGKVVLNTETSGFSRIKGGGIHVILRGAGNWAPKGAWEGQVERVVRSEAIAVPEGGAILAASGPRGEALTALREGDPIRLELNAGGLDWTQYDQAIGGGPFLVRDGKIAIDWDYQGFRPGFANGRHPRTAVGRTKSGEIWFITVDGRQALSVGATLEETAQIMKRLGCIEAINLDGGGSTTFHLLGMTLNRPSDGREREVANGVLFLGEPARHHGTPIKIRAPQKAFLDRGETLNAVSTAGVKIPNQRVIWHAAGAGWIDQGGFLRPISAGAVKVTAWSEGQTATAEINFVERPQPPVKKKPVVKKKPTRSKKRR